MVLLSFTRPDGKPIYINPKAVSYITPEIGANMQTRLAFLDGDDIGVQEPFHYVVRTLTDGSSA